MRLFDPKQEKAARADAFLAVPLYKAIYEKFKGTTLPPNVALENEMVTLGVAQKQKDKARQAFQRSAEQAGFLWAGKERLVMPKASVAATVEEPQDSLHADDEPNEKPRDRSRGNGGDDGGGRHPLIAGLLATLPPEKSEWGTEDRVSWLQAAAQIFNLIYTNTSGRKSVTISAGDSSAK